MTRCELYQRHPGSAALIFSYSSRFAAWFPFAGSGKTGVLTARIVHLIENGGVDPSRILAITFTNKAAQQIRARVKAALAASAASRSGNRELPWAGTFHSVGVRLIRVYAKALGLRPSFSMLDREDSVGLMKIVRQDLGRDHKELEFPSPKTCIEICSVVARQSG